MSIRTLSLSAMLLATPAIVASAPAEAASNKQVLQQVEKHIDTVRTMTASFRQTDAKGRTVTGNMKLKRPGHIRFDYQNSANMLIVGDGKSLNMIDYQVNQVQSWPISNSPLSAILDPSRDLATYGEVKRASKQVVSVLVKDPRRPEYGTITLIFTRNKNAPAGLSLHSWVALDSKNKQTTVRLSNVRYNVPMSNSAFSWKDPRK